MDRQRIANNHKKHARMSYNKYWRGSLDYLKINLKSYHNQPYSVFEADFLLQGSHKNSTRFHDFSMIFHDKKCIIHDYLMHDLKPPLLGASSTC